MRAGQVAITLPNNGILGMVKFVLFSACRISFIPSQCAGFYRLRLALFGKNGLNRPLTAIKALAQSLLNGLTQHLHCVASPPNEMTTPPGSEYLFDH